MSWAEGQTLPVPVQSEERGRSLPAARKAWHQGNPSGTPVTPGLHRTRVLMGL